MTEVESETEDFNDGLSDEALDRARGGSDLVPRRLPVVMAAPFPLALVCSRAAARFRF